MANYKTGIESSSRILASAKMMFYKYGYKKTTIAMIAEYAHVPVSLVTYYYKKEELLLSIHEDYINSILRAINEQVGEFLDNSLQMHLMLLQIQHIGINGDERNLIVYRYMVDNGLLSPEVTRIVDSYLLECISEFGIKMGEDEYARLIVAQYGAYREIIRVYLRDYDPVMSKPLINFSGTIALRLARVDQDVIDANIKKADELLGRMDLSGVRFLA